MQVKGDLNKPQIQLCLYLPLLSFLFYSVLFSLAFLFPHLVKRLFKKGRKTGLSKNRNFFAFSLNLLSLYRIDANQELFALGLADLVGSMFLSFPVSSSMSRTALNVQSGAMTNLSSIVCTGTFMCLGDRFEKERELSKMDSNINVICPTVKFH